MVVRALDLTVFHVWGHSWGTALAVLYALTQPQGLRSMTLGSPILDIPTYRQDVTNLLARQPQAVQVEMHVGRCRGPSDAYAYPGGRGIAHRQDW